VLEVAESQDKGIFLILLIVGIGCTLCCIGIVYFIIRQNADSEEDEKITQGHEDKDVEDVKRTPGHVHNVEDGKRTPGHQEDLDEMWTQRAVEIKVEE